MELIVGREDDGERRVRVERREGGYRVHWGDRAVEVDVAPTGATGRSLLLEGRQVELSVRRQAGGRYRVGGAEGSAVLEVLDPLTHLARESRAGGRGHGPLRVDSYMPGRVVALLAREGAAVSAGQGVVVLEAMKMENEIQAERDGLLRAVFVSPGQAVERGDPLFEIA